jgi:predicted Zn-dependent protease with MMP-like domain
VCIVEAALLLEEGEPGDALKVIAGAERSADPALFFQLRALSRYDLCEFEAAIADAERALAIHPAMAEGHDLLSRSYDQLGRREQSDEHSAIAEQVDSERFPRPLPVSSAEFDKIVKAAVEELPAKIRKELEHVPVLVEDLPDRRILCADSPPLSPDLLGLFAGHDLLAKRHDDLPGSPAVIFLFRRNLLRFCRTEEELREEVRVTVRHEVGHLLGLDEDDLDRWGLA